MLSLSSDYEKYLAQIIVVFVSDHWLNSFDDGSN